MKTELGPILVLGVAIMASLFAHTFFIILGFEKEQTPVSIEIIFQREAPQEATTEEDQNGLSKDEGDPSKTQTLSPKSASHSAAEANTGWRARWRAKQKRYDEDAQIHQSRIALLNQGQAQKQTPLDALFVCGLKQNSPVRSFKERDVSHWSSLVPAGLFSASYMEGMALIKTQKTSPKGAMQFALPARVLHVPMDIPQNAVVEIGRRDRRCLVGVRYADKGVFPIALTHIPVRVLQQDSAIEDAIVDVLLHRDGTLSITTLEGELKIAQAAVYDHQTAARSLQMHYAGAALFRKIR